MIARMLAAALVAVAPWAWPTGSQHEIVRPYIAPLTAYGVGHRGIDIAAPAGATVYAPDDGVVSFAGVVVDRPVLSILHDGGLVSSYEPVASDLPAGTFVHRGEAVGTLVTGHCGSPCLHFGVRLHGEYVSPLRYLGGVIRPRLLPTRRSSAEASEIPLLAARVRLAGARSDSSP